MRDFDESVKQSIAEVLLDLRNTFKVDAAALMMIKNYLNRFFADSTCKEVIFTSNTDNDFFGIKVMPVLDPEGIYEYVMGEDPYRVDRYSVEIDSKLLNPVLGLEANDILAVLLYEINQLIGNSSPMDDARYAIFRYLDKNHDHLNISKSIHYKEILTFGLKDYLSKCRSLFYADFENDSDIRIDEFIHSISLEDNLVDAYRKLRKYNIKMYENAETSKFITMSWVLGLYKNLGTRRIGAIHTLERAKLLTGSRLEKHEIDNVIKKIKMADSMIHESGLLNKIKTKFKASVNRSRMGTVRDIDNEYYELNMRARNVEDQDDAMYLMRRINTNMSIVAEYMNECDDKHDRDEMKSTYEKQMALREKLSSSTVYKNLGIFVNYPDIVENRY